MKNLNLEYLSNNYLTLEQVSLQSGVTSQEIEDKIQNQLLPEPSYQLNHTIEITSPLGDRHKLEGVTSYFPPSYVNLVKRSTDEPADKIKQKFIDEMKGHLLKHPSREVAYGGVLGDDHKLDEALEQEWEAYCKGIYGICTLNATAPEIIEKEIAVKKLIKFLNSHSDNDLKNRRSELTRIIEEYDRVSNLFAPYQRESSSRGKYVDRPLEAVGLESQIRKY